jgi:DNA-binding FadR family transcriptional regulator
MVWSNHLTKQTSISDKYLKPGDKGPDKRELTEQPGVSRGTLREAFRMLEYSGLITIRKGIGGDAFVLHSSSAVVRQMAHALGGTLSCAVMLALPLSGPTVRTQIELEGR